MAIQIILNESSLNNVPALKRIVGSKRPLMRILGQKLLTTTINSFKQETSPDGRKWARLSPAYERRKNAVTRSGNARRAGQRTRKILRASGLLFDSFGTNAGDDFVEVTTNRPVGDYSLSAIHQYGAPRANIPARPHLPLTSEGDLMRNTEGELVELAQDYFSGN